LGINSLSSGFTENESDKNTGIVQKLINPAYAPEADTEIVSPVLFAIL
jgi:hypothetical protein